jgi:hypothetical protein
MLLPSDLNGNLNPNLYKDFSSKKIFKKSLHVLRNTRDGDKKYLIWKKTIHLTE